jgi:hypothetical protein
VSRCIPSLRCRAQVLVLFIGLRTDEMEVAFYTASMANPTLRLIIAMLARSSQLDELVELGVIPSRESVTVGTVQGVGHGCSKTVIVYPLDAKHHRLWVGRYGKVYREAMKAGGDHFAQCAR